MVEVKRKKGETFESMLRRFNKAILKSGKILHAKKKRYKEKEKSRNLVKENTLVRLQMRMKREYLKKIGRLDETETKRKW